MTVDLGDLDVMTPDELAAAERETEARIADALARPIDPDVERRVREALDRGYPVRVWREPEGYFVAVAPDVEGAIGTGDDAASAVADLEDALAAWFESAIVDGQALPEPRVGPEQQYSGRFVLRVPKSLHRHLAERADDEGVSTNHLAATLIAEGLGRVAGAPAASARRQNG